MELDPVLVGFLVATPALSGSLLRILFSAWVDSSGGENRIWRSLACLSWGCWASLRASEGVVRVGGDEFVMLLSDVQADDARLVKARIQALQQLPLILKASCSFRLARE